MRLLLVRHAESIGNATGDYSAAGSGSLSERGERQARELAGALGPWAFDRILVSPIERARRTIQPYLAATGRTAEIWPEIAEACWHEQREPAAGRWQARAAAEPAGALSPLFRYRDGRALLPAQPESFGEGLRRVQCALEKVRDDFGGSGETVLMVTHGHFLRELLNLMRVRPDFVAFRHDNCAMTLVMFDHAWKLVFFNQPLPAAPPRGAPGSPGQ